MQPSSTGEETSRTHWHTLGLKKKRRMANVPRTSIRPWFLELVPLLVVILIAAHVIALVYWIYRLATEKQPQKAKKMKR
ncbi:hypothetical protein F511_26656 [Dorcoceras hygrometricum]|uniref:Uncharacterized protein n=1 Tax=Dorcoceras hygrometricum TaxID=472368 RepID=A0A2Z7AQ03_9LAMI|nr:hypothetical protein F511_26656 [Dorcoceras hygrometricum]